MPVNAISNGKKWLDMLFGSVDVFATLFTLLIAAWITNKYTKEVVVYDQEFILVSLVVLITWVILLKATHLARIPRTSAIPILLGDFVRLTTIGGIILLLLDFAIKLDNFPSITLAIFIGLNLIVLFVIRLLVFKVFKKFRANGYNSRNIIIIANEGTEAIINKLLNQTEWGFKIVCIVTDSKILNKKFKNRVKIYPKKVNIKSLIRHDIVDELICCDCLVPDIKFTQLTDYCHNIGVTVRIQGNQPFPERYNARTQYFDKIPFITIENSPTAKFTHLIKSVVEVSMAFLFLILLSPILAVVSLLIFVTSRGPIVYKQQRVGLRGRKFHIYKFRTTYFSNSKILISGKVDNTKLNYTPVGKLISKSKLDFIPQFLNVIKGEMALIGPQAPTVAEIENYADWQLKLISVKPGLTCTRQITSGDKSGKDEKGIKMDIQYIENWTLKSDIELFFKTFRVVLFPR